MGVVRIYLYKDARYNLMLGIKCPGHSRNFIWVKSHYTDTEGSFVVERLVDMAEAAVTHIANVADVDENGGELHSAKWIMGVARAGVCVWVSFWT